MNSRIKFNAWLITMPLILGVIMMISGSAAVAQYAPPGAACPVGGHAAVACPVGGDSVIQAAVQGRLAGSVINDQNQVCVQVTNGVVTLTGQVIDPNTSSIASLLAWSIPGVAGVNNQLTVLRYSTPESALVTEVRKRLDRAPDLRSKPIGIEASEGVVRLTGVVDTDQQREAATYIVLGVPGVTAVQNNLTVRLPWTQ